MKAKDLMQTDLMTVRESDSVDDLLQVLVDRHIHGAPVVNDDDELVGVVTQQDLFFGTMTHASQGKGGVPGAGLKVGEIMTAPAVSASEDTDVRSLCELMHRLRIHRVPIVRGRTLTGLVSSLDVCALIAAGTKID
jgi:CBS domain-containing protein